MSSPTQRTLKKLRQDGYIVEVVERWNQYAGIRQDLFGVIDVVGVHAAFPGVLGVQTTSASNMSARRKKILASHEAHVWVQAGNTLVIHGWKKTIPQGKVRAVYELKEQEITGDMFEECTK